MRVAGALAVALALLTACGSTFTPPAAVVDGHRITQSTLATTLAAFQAEPDVASQFQGAEGQRDLTRRVLRYLVQVQVLQEYAQERGITVSRGEVDQELASEVQQQGGPAAFERFRRQRHLSEATVRENIARNLLIEKVANAVVGNATGQTAQALFGQWLTQRMRRVHLQVNPRYGRFDSQTGEITSITSTGLLTG